MSAAGPGKWDQAIAAGRIEPGMPTYIAVGLLGREPDQAAEVGAACGMLDVLTWHQEQTRIVTSDGVVTSVTTASKP
jgi:hypothetical protein